MYPISAKQWIAADDGQRVLGRNMSIITSISTKMQTIVENNQSILRDNYFHIFFIFDAKIQCTLMHNTKNLFFIFIIYEPFLKD